MISVAELSLHRLSFNQTYPAGSLDYQTEDFRQAGPLSVAGVADLVGNEIRVRGRLTVRIRCICDRCTEPTEIGVERDFDLFYRAMETIAHDEEVEVPADELDVGFYAGEGVELKDIVTEQVLLAMPMKVLCRPDCQGLCPVCGINRNRQSCQCVIPGKTSPFEALRER